MKIVTKAVSTAFTARKRAKKSNIYNGKKNKTDRNSKQRSGKVANTETRALVSKITSIKASEITSEIATKIASKKASEKASGS